MYKLIIKSAFSSLMQRKSRTFLVIFMIASSLWGLMLMQGIYDGMIKQMIDNALRSDCGEISIFAKDFRANRDIDKYIKKTAKIEELLNKEQNIRSYTKRIVAGGLAATAKYSKNSFIYGIDIDDEIKQGSMDRYIKKGSFDFGKKNKGVIVGFKLAKKLKVDIGKKVILTTQDIDNEVSSISLRVTGIIKTNNMAFDESAVFIDINKAKKFLNLNGVNQISIMVHDPLKIEDTKKILSKSTKTIEVFTWSQLYPALLQSKEMMVTFGYISYLIVFLTATVGIFGVVLVSVMERIREFGILRAIGTRFRLIASMIFFESFFIGLMGFILGSILGSSTLYYFALYGLDLSSFSDALDEFGMDAVTYALIKTEYFITALIAVFSAIILSILIPLRILKKSKPIEVING